MDNLKKNLEIEDRVEVKSDFKNLNDEKFENDEFHSYSDNDFYKYNNRQSNTSRNAYHTVK